MSSAINNVWFPSADVIIQSNVENVKRSLLGKGRGFVLFRCFSSLSENTNRTNQEEDENVNVRGANNTLSLSLSLHWLVQSHTGVTKSYRFMADGKAGLVSE